MHADADPSYLKTLRRVRDNILSFQAGILHRDATLRRDAGCELRLRYRAVAARRRLHPRRRGGLSVVAVDDRRSRAGGRRGGDRRRRAADEIRRLQHRSARRVPRAGRHRSPPDRRRQAVAALAYGIEGIAPVDKIVGPGNLFVALAKRQVFGAVDIDSIAGPSEVVLIADWTADPRFIAADLISQAEHSPGASVLITWEPDLIDRVVAALEDQLAMLSRGDLARDSLERFGADPGCATRTRPSRSPT